MLEKICIKNINEEEKDTENGEDLPLHIHFGHLIFMNPGTRSLTEIFCPRNEAWILGDPTYKIIKPPATNEEEEAIKSNMSGFEEALSSL